MFVFPIFSFSPNKTFDFDCLDHTVMKAICSPMYHYITNVFVRTLRVITCAVLMSGWPFGIYWPSDMNEYLSATKHGIFLLKADFRRLLATWALSSTKFACLHELSKNIEHI